MSKNLNGLDGALALIAPGLTGRIVRWMDKSAIKPQPVLALGAALALVGMLKAHRVRSTTNLRTNLLLAGVAPSGSGKNHPLECVKTILTEAKLKSLLGGEPASDGGLIRTLQNNNGVALILWDEFGYAIKRLGDSGARGFETEILSVMTQLFSCASGTFVSKSFADQTRKSGTQIDQPHLCVFGASTPDRLYNSLSSGLAEDGFLARFLFLECEEADPAERLPTFEERRPPADIIRDVKEIYMWPTNVSPSGGNLSTFLDIIPRVVPFDESAKRMLEVIQTEFGKLLARSKNDLVRSIYARGREHTIKIALTVCDGDSIGEDALFWSFNIAKYCCDLMAKRVDETIGDSKNERNAKKVLRIIREAGRISQSSLTRRTQYLKNFEREEILDNLLECQSVNLEVIKEENSKKSTRYYLASNNS